ncbi:MAG TPA: prephenate dehydrogenase [Thermomicrobiales bacterium]|nr:prephenate dehydrogenase [Thermomicrobiales bacterium]
MQNVTIIGLGLIGGSIGLALRRWSTDNSNALHVVGFDDDMDKQARAKRMGAVDDTEWSLAAAVKNADVVIVATPVGTMLEVFENIAEHLKPGAIVTDTGSTKADVMQWARALPTTVQFIGGHPMAGKSESLEAADANLFNGATWVVCPSVSASESAIRNVLGIISATNAEAFFADPVEHDSYVAGISHLPFLIAATLVDTVTTDQSWRDMSSLASSGFRDTTRLALGNPQMHRDILMTNKEAVIRWIDQLQANLARSRELLAGDDEGAGADLLAFFQRAQDERAKAEVTASRAAEQKMADGVEPGTVGDQMSRMFFGGFGRKKKGEKDQRS